MALLIFVACGTNSAPPVPVTVTGQPMLMTLKVGTAGWKPVAGTYDVNENATTYQIDVTDEFELVGACKRANGTFFVSEVFGTVDDATVTLGAWTVPDCVRVSGFLPPPSTTDVVFTATADVDAGLDLDTIGHTLHAGVPGTFTTWQGVHDLITIDPTNNRILVDHDVEIVGGTDLGTLAVGAQGEPMITQGYSADLQPDEGASVTTDLLTSRGAFHRWSPPDHTTALFVPRDQLATGDQQRFVFEITAPPASFRGAISSSFDRSVPGFQLLPRLTDYGTRPGELGASWTPFSDFYTDVLVTIDNQQSTLDVSKSKLWLERHHTSTIDFDVDFDGYDPSWMVANPFLSLEVRRWNENINLISGAGISTP
ncbi:MAG: hypothetical protein ABJE66_16835 [Deltaproteobacteria bacterium]